MKLLEDHSDEELRQLAEDSAATVDRIGGAAKHGMTVLSSAEAENTLRQLKELRDASRAGRVELEDAARTIQSLRGQLTRAEAELAEKTAALRLVDPDTVRSRIEDARAAGRAEAAADSETELAELRAEVAQQRAWVEELRANKRKLRETIERLKEGR